MSIPVPVPGTVPVPSLEDIIYVLAEYIHTYIQFYD